jgi:AcrR family transcriptional regulator
MQSVEKFAKVPKQERSRRSFDKAIDAAVSLVLERRSDSFTLAEVADRSGVSIGAIYGRVASKADLLRTAHAREMARLTERTLEAFRPGPGSSEELKQTVGRVVRTTGEVLRDNSSILAGFMFLANADEEILAVGQASFNHLVDAFTHELMAHRDEITVADPDQAVRWSFTMVYSVIARWLGLGSDPAAAGEGEWDELLAQMTEMVTAYLTR